MALLVLKKGKNHVAIWRTTLLAAGNNMYSDPIDLREIDGYLSAGWTITGNGTVRFEFLSCIDGTNFLDVNGDIAAAQTRLTGPNGDGINGASITAVPCPFAKIRATETGGANSATITFHLYGN